MKRVGMGLGLILVVSMAPPASAAPPSNDNFGDATEITTLPYSASEDLEEATTEPDEPQASCGWGSGGGTVWFALTPTTDTALAVDTWGSSTGVALAVYRDWDPSNPGILEIACNGRVWTPTDTPPHSHVTELLEAGGRYFIQVTNLGNCCPPTSGLEISFDRRRMTPGVRRMSYPCPWYGEGSCPVWLLNRGFDPTAEEAWPYFAPNAIAFMGDWRRRGEFGYGTGITSPAVRRDSLWYLTSGWTEGPSTTRIVPFGRSVATPVVGDNDGDGATDIGVVDGNAWFFDYDLNGLCDLCGYRYGSGRDVKVVGDWDGDGDATPGVRKGNVWYLKNNPCYACDDGNADVVFAYGSANDQPIVGDWDGDGDWTVGVLKGNVWYLNNGTGPNGDIVFTYGKVTDRAVAGHWGPFA